MTDYVVNDSGKRTVAISGFQRDTNEGKPRYDLVDRAYLRRFAMLMGRGAEKYGANNWRLANDREALDRFVESALRHTYEWIDQLYADLDGSDAVMEVQSVEDHAVMAGFNVMAAEDLKTRLLAAKPTVKEKPIVLDLRDINPPSQQVEEARTPADELPDTLFTPVNGNSLEPDHTLAYPPSDAPSEPFHYCAPQFITGGGLSQEGCPRRGRHLILQGMNPV